MRLLCRLVDAAVFSQMSTERVIAMFPCPCCGYRTLRDEPPGTFDVCPVCYWEDDPVQYAATDWAGGANAVSLSVARRNFEKFGAVEERFRANVRAPLPHERA